LNYTIFAPAFKNSRKKRCFFSLWSEGGDKNVPMKTEMLQPLCSTCPAEYLAITYFWHFSSKFTSNLYPPLNVGRMVLPWLTWKAEKKPRGWLGFRASR
jgi:hypothetical protein